MAWFELRVKPSHKLTLHNTRARGWNARVGGWATIPMCSCGWNDPRAPDSVRQYFHSPQGSMFADHYETDERATKEWRQHLIEDCEPEEEFEMLMELDRVDVGSNA